MQDQTSRQGADDRQGGKAENRMPWLESIDQSQLQIEDDSLRRTWLIAGAAILAMVLFSGLVWYLYGRASGVGPDAPFLVQAPAGPTKVEPAERGGMEVPHQKRLVFGRVSGQEKPLEEKVIAGPEEPLERPQPVPEPKPPATEAPSPSEPVVTSPSIEVAPKAEPRPSQTPVALTGYYRLQLGAFGQEESARTNWRAMQNRHSTVLAALDFEIEPVSLGARTLYRLRAGSFGSRAEAERACSQLKAAGQECHVVVP